MESVNITDFCVSISFPYLFFTPAALLLLQTLLQHEKRIAAQLETCENSAKGVNNGVNKNGLDSLPSLPTAWTIA